MSQDVSGITMRITHLTKRMLEKPYLLFEEVSLLQGERVGLGNDGDDVDHLAEAPHEFHIQRPQAEEVVREEKIGHELTAVADPRQQGAADTYCDI